MPYLESLIGSWQTDPNDHFSLDNYGLVTLTFRGDGKLFYHIHRSPQDKIIEHNFWLEENILVVDQGKDTPLERTPFQLTPEGRLLLYYQGQQLYYLRQS